jgi:luciferase family oxidoreductase group 1
MPAGTTAPELWVLGSSEYGALLAAKMGLPYAYAHFIGGDAPQIAQAYRQAFRPGAGAQQPHCIVATAAIVAPTDAEAEELALALKLWRARVLQGQGGPIPSLADARAYSWTALERHEIERSRRILAGSPATVRAGIERIVEAYAADEVMVVTITPDYPSRLRSYELLADAFAAPQSRVS